MQNANPSPQDTAVAADLLDALGRADLALGLVDCDGLLRWCTPRFAALFAPPAEPSQPLERLLGAADAQHLLAGGETGLGLPGDGARWRLRAGAATPAGLRLIRAEPADETRALRAEIARLEDRLDLVQTFSRTGVFTRDPVTLAGTWDAHMYRIWGLPEAPPGAPSLPHDSLRDRMFREDRGDQQFTDTLNRPGTHAQRVRIHRFDGQVRHLNTQWRVTLDAQGRPQQVLGTNTDDTEVYELANRAEQLRTELEAALELGHIALWRHALDSDRVTLDRRGCEIIGVPYDEQGVPLAEARARIHPDDLAQVEASVALTLRTGEPSDMELRYPQAGGGWKHVLLRRALQRTPDGAPLGFVGVMLDVTERVEQARQALAYARRLESAAEAARIGLWSTEPGSTLPSWNRRMYELFGLDPREGPLSLPDWLARCVHPSDLARVRATVLAWWQAGEAAVEIEFRVVRPSDGQQRWLVVRGELTRDGEGRDRHAEGVAIDITEQQQTLRQLRDTVERMTLTSAALGLGTWESDRTGDDINWDTQMFRLRGIESPGRRISRAEIATFLHPDGRQLVMDSQVGRMDNGMPWHLEFRIVRPDGQVRWITSQSVPLLDEQGREERRIGVNWDSTEAHVAAEALRQRELALAESQAKSQTMSRISHELRTPLNAVLGFVQLLRGPPGEGDAALEAGKRQRWLAHIDEAGRHLLALIDDVLELSRAGAGEGQLSLQPLALAPFVEATLPLVAAEAQARGISIQAGALEGTVLADPVRLRQVLINLLSNAIKYNRPGGRVRLAARADGEWLALSVADTGLGIAPERLQHAFEPFNRLGAEATGIEGSGIGLAIVKVLVEHMGGRVAVRSEPGEGSEFTIVLPAAAAAAPASVGPTQGLPAAAEAVPPRPPQPPACVLYIEDNPVNALLVRELLADRPAVRLELAETGRAGVQRARELAPALILLDMQLPDIDGLAVLQALRADPLTAAIRCVALSANATPDVKQAALAAGFADYWTKPFRFERFLQDLGALLGREV
ncbi:MAG: PAS domain-containing protein [Burkholderiaceae bacterium]|nr:PAS domain-containing protein [Burkholderiaceae bacterium]